MTDYGFDGPLLNPGHYDDDSSTGLYIEALLDEQYTHHADDKRKSSKEDEA